MPSAGKYIAAPDWSKKVCLLRAGCTTIPTNRRVYYMASSVSGQDDQILRCGWLPERARWSYLARSRLPALSRKKNFSESHIINPLLTKLVRSRWLDIGLDLFFRVYGPRLRKHAKNRTRPMSSHLDRTSLVNNPYLKPKFTLRVLPKTF